MKLSFYFFAAFFITTQLFSQNGWEHQAVNSSNQYGAICAIDENLVHVILDDGIFIKSTDGGLNWLEYYAGVSEYFFDMVFYNNDIGFAVGANGSIIKTINGGEDWTLLSSGTSNDLFSISMPSLNNIWIAGDNGTILNSTNQGDTWTLFDSISSEKLNSISFRDADIGFVAGNNGALFHTQNGGVLWEESNISTTDDLFSITTSDNFSFLLAGEVLGSDYYGFSGFKTSNNTDWTNLPISVFGFGLSKIYFNNDDLGFSSETADALCDCVSLLVSKTTDSGENWEESCVYETTITSNQLSHYSDIDFATDEIGYVLSGNIILKVTDCDTTILLNTNNLKFSNNAFTLYPNPTSSNSINIDFNTIYTSELSIKLFDINGKILLSESSITPKTSIDISSISQGIYFVSLLKEGHIITTQKLIINP